MNFATEEIAERIHTKNTSSVTNTEISSIIDDTAINKAIFPNLYKLKKFKFNEVLKERPSTSESHKK
jgi:hypothetical protein